MRELKWKIHQYSFKPADYDSETPEVRKIMDVHRGTWVKGVSVRIGETFIAGTTPTISVGDHVHDGVGDIDGYVAPGDITITSTGLYDGNGAYFSAANGRLYTEDDTIDLIYTGVAEPATTQGLATVYIVYAEIE